MKHELVPLTWTEFSTLSVDTCQDASILLKRRLAHRARGEGKQASEKASMPRFVAAFDVIPGCHGAKGSSSLSRSDPEVTEKSLLFERHDRRYR